MMFMGDLVIRRRKKSQSKEQGAYESTYHPFANIRSWESGGLGTWYVTFLVKTWMQG